MMRSSRCSYACFSHESGSGYDRTTVNDTKIIVWRLPPLFSQEGSQRGKRRNLGTFKTRAAAEKHEREVQYFKRHS